MKSGKYQIPSRITLCTLLHFLVLVLQCFYHPPNKNSRNQLQPELLNPPQVVPGLGLRGFQEFWSDKSQQKPPHLFTSSRTRWWQLQMGVSLNSGFSPQIIHLFIGFSIMFTIHFGGNTPIFGNIQIFFDIFNPDPWGKWSNLTNHIFQNGLVQPPTRRVWFSTDFPSLICPRWWYHWSKTHPSSWPETQATSIVLGDWNFSENFKVCRKLQQVDSFNDLFVWACVICLLNQNFKKTTCKILLPYDMYIWFQVAASNQQV